MFNRRQVLQQGVELDLLMTAMTRLKMQEEKVVFSEGFFNVVFMSHGQLGQM